MASSSEIEKLERRCAENPHGLTFAPLAEAYRKHGDLDRALEVLRTGRELHPDYIPASIVLGRCHLDRGDLAEAERSFAHVLTLDPENVIALKALADLAEREGRGVQAERWLNLLLAVDPSNDDARSQLERIRTGEAVAEVEPPAVQAAETVDAAEAAETAEAVEVAEIPEPVEAPAATENSGPLEIVEEQPELAVAAADEEQPPVELVPPIDDHAVMSAADPDEVLDPPADRPDFGIMVEQEQEIVLMPAAESDYRAEVPGALPEAAADDDHEELPDPFAGVPDESRSDTDGPDVFDVPAYASDAPGHAAASDHDVWLAEADAADPADAAASGLEPVPDLTSELGSSESIADTAAPDLDEPALAEPETLYPEPAGAELSPVVTESMAELYMRQGHRADALAIYRQLADRRPDDERLAGIVGGLSAEIDAAPAVTRAYSAAQTGGRSVGEMLRGLLAERLPTAPAAPEMFPEPTGDVPEFRARDEVLGDAEDHGEPTRPADDHLTLGAVFGEDESGGAPPAVAPGSDAASGHDGGLSFDEFFGPPPAAEADATRTSPPAPSGDPDDLDQFHAWLQSLKR